MRAAGIAIAVISTALLVVAFGGGGSDANTADGRAMPLAAGLGQTITWTPASITDTANPGSRQDIPISFTASANVANVSISVVPALQKLVSVTPTSFASLQKGQVVKLTLSVAPSGTAALGTVEGTVHARTGAATIASPLPVTVLVATGAVGLLPPDPGAAGMATLAGIDSDNDGVRDDVERYIWLTYPASQKTRAALTQIAKADQNALVAASTSDRSAAVAASHLSVSGTACLRYSFGQAATSIENQLIARELNTQLRWKAYSVLQGMLGGEGYRLLKDKKSGCVVDPNTLTN